MNDQQKISILLVDDDEVDRYIVKKALKKTNTNALLTEVYSGQEAICVLKETATKSDNLAKDRDEIHDLDIVLLDYRLPDIDGLQLIPQIKALGLQIPIFVLTGQGDEEIAVEVMKAGAVDYLSKAKIEPTSFVKAIKNAIRLNRAEQAVRLTSQRLRASNELLVAKNRELERQQERIRSQNAKLQEAYKLKSEFLATMSHELRTPMNAIMGFSQLLLRQYPDPLSQQQQNLIQRIFNNSNNLLAMINEMLDYSKIESGKLEVRAHKFDLSSLLQLTTEELRSLAIQKKLDLSANIQLEDSYLKQDANFVKRIVVNLLSNAIKFTETGKIILKATDRDQANITISVIDTGIGIAPQDQAKIFQAFRQADQTFTRQHAGTGLGLAITESLVASMGGTIVVESKLDRGSTFTVKIPRKYDG